MGCEWQYIVYEAEWQYIVHEAEWQYIVYEAAQTTLECFRKHSCGLIRLKVVQVPKGVWKE